MPKPMPPSAFDDLPGPDWIDPEEDRAFYCDAFISHRRFDQSESLGASLTNKGVRVWHDTNADLADRRVRDHIRLALASSRTVVVCLEGASETSEWCRAEYRPALSVEATGALSRVAVAVLGPGAIIPSEFAGCPKFQVSDQIDDLANFLRGQNRLPFTPNDLMSRGLRVSRESLQKALENEPAPRHPEAKLALSLAKAAAAGPFDADDINRRLLPLSQKLLRTPQLISELEPQEIDILRTLAVFIAREGSADVRMNGFWLLSALADEHNALITPDDLVQILAGESDPSIISSMARTLDLIRPKLTPSAQSSIEFLALKQFYGPPGTSLPLMELSEAARCRILVTTSQTLGELPFSERALLAEQQLLALEADDSATEIVWEAWARDVFIGDLSIATFSFGSEPEFASDADRRRAFGLILGLANSLLKRPDILVSLSNAFEIAFLPLSWFQGVPEFARQARCLYAKLAHAIATGSSKKAYLIPAWLLIPDRITAGANLQEAILDMQTKSDKLNQLFDHLINLERFGSPDQHEKINKKKKEMIETAVREAEVSISRWC